MTALRKKHGFPAVEEVRDKCLMIVAIKNRGKYIQQNKSLDGPNTRARSRGDIPHPICKGQMGKKTSTATDAII